MSVEFLKLGRAKFLTLMSIIEAGYSVLFSEIDVYEFRDPEQCETANFPQDQTQGCIYAGDNFDLEIQSNILPGKVAMAGSELNIGFFYLRSSVATIAFLDEIVKCLKNNCGWDQSVFTSIVWERQCCFVDDNSDMEHQCSVTNKCLQMRILSVYHFPTGGSGGLRRRRSRQFGIVPPEYYTNTKTCPVLVHCTGRTGLQAKLDCSRRVEDLYGNCSTGA